MASAVNKGIINNYVKKHKNLTQYTAFRGVTDYSQIGQFNLFETGYSFLSIIKMPTFIEKLAEQDSNVAILVNNFRHAVEYEFRGMSGLPDVTGETFEITDGINSQQLINKVTSDTSVTLSSGPYYEKTGGVFTKFTEYYLTGIKDKMTQAKTYHGLIKNGLLEPGFENETFTLMYYVTDNTMLELEKAYLLANCQLTTASNSMYDSNKGDINTHEITLSWNCFPITGVEVDKAAKVLLQDITGVSVTHNDSVGNVTRQVVEEEGTTRANGTTVATLDSANYKYGIMDSNSASVIEDLVNAASRA